MKIIEDVWKFKLCTGCGTCVGVCPRNALQLSKDPRGGTVVPVLENSKSCSECGLCVQVCSGLHPDLDKLNLSIFGKPSRDTLLGNWVNLYVGHSTNEKIRGNAASGGLVTELLVFALKEGMIDGALVTRMKRGSPLEPEVFLARTVEEVLSASKSKYCPVPLNTGIKDIMSENGEFAVVGLPCHIHGLRKAEMINGKLKEKIAFHLGLFCGRTVNFWGTRFLLEKMGIRSKDIMKLDHRDSGWPGNMTVQLKDGTEKSIPHRTYWGHFFGYNFFTPLRCTLCSDALNELADVSLGDAWLPELMTNNAGESMIITRTKVGEGLLGRAISKRRVEVTRVRRQDIIRAQRGMLFFKKRELVARVKLLKRLGKRQYDVYLEKKYPSRPNIGTYLRSTLAFINIYVSSKQKLRWLLKYIPLKLLRFYVICYNLINPIRL